MKISDIDTFRSDVVAEKPIVPEAKQEPIMTIELTKDECDYLKAILLEKRRGVKKTLRTPEIKESTRKSHNRLLGIITNLEYKIDFEHKLN